MSYFNRSLIKSPSEIVYIRNAGKITNKILDEVSFFLKEGISGIELDAFCEELINSMGGSPAFKGYKGFPSSTCISVNDVVIHGIPNNIKFKNGDIVSLDIGVNYAGYFADAARTYMIGEVDERTRDLVKVAKECLFLATLKASAGNRLTDISWAVQSHAEKNGFEVIKKYGGHGVGKKLHEKPFIFNYGKPGNGLLLKAGMVLAIEPMLTIDSDDVRTLDDGWSVITNNGLPAAHFENTVLVKEGEADVLT